jgi:hypothetical protein
MWRVIAVPACLSAIALAGCSGHTEAANHSPFDTPRLIARDVASQAGIARTVTTEGENCVFDYNRDGVKDLFLSTHDAAPWQLFRGLPDGTFVDSNVGTFPRRDRHGCATGDFNGDGRPDIYASIGACAGTCTAPKELWIQTADGRFVDRAAQFGITDPGGRGRQPITLNANGDKWPDLFTGQAPGVDYPSPNRLWVNQGGAGFIDPAGLPTEEIGNQCVTAGDFDSDGYDELVVCGGGGQIVETVFRAYDNSGGTWSDATAAVGLPRWERRDAELADLNRDGWLDLVTVTGNRLEVRLNTGGRFPTISYSLALSDGRDVAVGDAEGDGDQDIYVVQGSNASVPDLLLLNRGSGVSYTNFSGLPQVTTGEGDTAQAIPNWKGTNRAAFLVNNGRAYPEPGPRQLIELLPGPSRCARRPATIVGTAGRDKLVGTRKRDVIAALGGRDIVKARSRNDIVCAGPGNDEVAGGAGKDKLFGGKGKDKLLGGKGRDKLFGGKEKDKLYGGPSMDACAGGPGEDAEKSC